MHVSQIINMTINIIIKILPFNLSGILLMLDCVFVTILEILDVEGYEKNHTDTLEIMISTKITEKFFVFIRSKGDFPFIWL